MPLYPNALKSYKDLLLLHLCMISNCPWHLCCTPYCEDHGVEVSSLFIRQEGVIERHDQYHLLQTGDRFPQVIRDDGGISEERGEREGDARQTVLFDVLKTLFLTLDLKGNKRRIRIYK